MPKIPTDNIQRAKRKVLRVQSSKWSKSEDERVTILENQWHNFCGDQSGLMESLPRHNAIVTSMTDNLSQDKPDEKTQELFVYL